MTRQLFEGISDSTEVWGLYRNVGLDVVIVSGCRAKCEVEILGLDGGFRVNGNFGGWLKFGRRYDVFGS